MENEKEYGYCLRCKSKQEMLEVEEITCANGRDAKKGKCKECETKMFRFIKINRE